MEKRDRREEDGKGVGMWDKINFQVTCFALLT
jgi:hypothetical protein